MRQETQVLGGKTEVLVITPHCRKTVCTQVQVQQVKAEPIVVYKCLGGNFSVQLSLSAPHLGVCFHMTLLNFFLVDVTMLPEPRT